MSPAVIVPSKMLEEETQPVQTKGLVTVRVLILALSMVTLPRKTRVLAPVEITVEASKLMLSLNSEKSKELTERSLPKIDPSRIFVLLIQPVQFKLDRERVVILALSKFTVLPRKLKLKLEPEMTVLASRAIESLKRMKSRVLAEMLAPVRVPVEMSDPRMEPSRMLLEFTMPVPIKGLIKVRVVMLAESKLTVFPRKDRLKLEPEITVFASSSMESLNWAKSKALAEIADPVRPEMAVLAAEVILPS